MVQAHNEKLAGQVASLEGQVETGQKLEKKEKEALQEQAVQQESGIQILKEELDAACSRAEEAETKMAGFTTTIRVCDLVVNVYWARSEEVSHRCIGSIIPIICSGAGRRQE